MEGKFCKQVQVLKFCKQVQVFKQEFEFRNKQDVLHIFLMPVIYNIHVGPQ